MPAPGQFVQSMRRCAVALPELLRAPVATPFTRALFLLDHADSALFHVLEDTVRLQNAAALGLLAPAATPPVDTVDAADTPYVDARAPTETQDSGAHISATLQSDGRAGRSASPKVKQRSERDALVESDDSKGTMPAPSRAQKNAAGSQRSSAAGSVHGVPQSQKQRGRSGQGDLKQAAAHDLGHSASFQSDARSKRSASAPSATGGVPQSHTPCWSVQKLHLGRVCSFVFCHLLNYHLMSIVQCAYTLKLDNMMLRTSGAMAMLVSPPLRQQCCCTT